MRKNGPSLGTRSSITSATKEDRKEGGVRGEEKGQCKIWQGIIIPESSLMSYLCRVRATDRRRRRSFMGLFITGRTRGLEHYRTYKKTELKKRGEAGEKV